MPKKLPEIEDSIEYKEGVESFNLWKKTNKEFEKNYCAYKYRINCKVNSRIKLL